MEPIKISERITFIAKELGWKGSRQRCLLLTGMGKTALQKALLQIIGQETADKLKIKFTDEFDYYPKGFPNPNEIELDKVELPVNVHYREKLNKWWLKRSAKTPTWDLVCNAEINEEPGLILVEAKAYEGELPEEGSDAKEPNRSSIMGALKDVNDAYDYELSIDKCYQMSNRIAWGIKLASKGIPVVLIYLGFENAIEMDRGDLIETWDKWNCTVRKHSQIISFEDWEKEIPGNKLCNVNPSFFYPIIRTANVQLVSGNMSLECDLKVDEPNV
ncbi:MAG: hypothetical protein ACOYIS_02825 [Candidatus Cloacimonadaceae bacterium]|jgi:hypothetical protein